MTTLTERSGTDRRSVRSSFRYPERRSGFDRRSTGHLAWYRDRPLVVAAVLAGVALLNILDLVITTRLLANGAIEANPIMAALFETDLMVAAAFKLGLTLWAVAIIWLLRRYRLILQVSLVALFGFTLLVAYQLTLLGSLG